MSRPALQRAAFDDRGAYAVLYAFLVVALIGAGALVVDLSLMRESRATNRSATDSAATAAAARLNALDPAASNPQRACETAWEYLAAGIAELDDDVVGLGKDSCSSILPTTATACIDDPAENTVAPSLPDGWDVRITWPVLDGSSLLENPDVVGSNPAQELDADFDGSEIGDVCARIGVEVVQANDILLGAALEFSGTVDTRAASVARNTATGGDSNVIAALNILDRQECEVLQASGNGELRVEGADGRSGVIAVESNGQDCGSGDYPIATSGGGAIRATGPGGATGGAIQSFALTVGNLDEVAPEDGSVTPTPTPLPLPSGAQPVIEVFACTEAPCGDGGGLWLSGLTNALGSDDPPSPYPGADSPWDLQDFETLPGSEEAPDFDCNAADSLIIPPGNWYIDCSDNGNVLNISGTLVFEGGTIVTSGGVEVTGSGCLGVNVSLPSPTSDCSAVNLPSPSNDAIFFMREGSLEKDPDASLLLAQTFTYLDEGAYALGGGAGQVYLTHPQAQDCAQDAICRAQRFSPLILWSESTAAHRLDADDDLVLQGIVFTPNASTEFGGSGGDAAIDAQFWTRRMENQGDTNIILTAQPGASISRPAPGVSLIR